jgi:3-polyprenyl-4-hydroxybenzoate decarboxylase
MGVCQANNLAHGRTLGLATNASVALLKRRKKISVMPDDRPFSVPHFSFFFAKELG